MHLTKSFLGSLIFFLLSSTILWGEDPRSTWIKLLEQKADCVTWVSVIVKIEVSSNGRSYPPSERKLEALGTVLSPEGLTVLSLHTMDPTESIRSRMRGAGDISVDYIEVMILQDDGSEIPAKFALKDEDLDLAFVMPLVNEDEKNASILYPSVSENSNVHPFPKPLDEVVSLGKLGRNLYRQPTLQRGWVNAVINKPRDYFVIENLSPGCPVFNSSGEWIGVSVYKKEGRRPSALVTLPATDIMEIADQARARGI
ncbi:S1C family serine protease [Opitutales bacterium]|nr:S1C family serine protease [Opitutales bacterium]